MATFLRTIDEIALMGVFEAGIPNQERIAYRAQRQVNLAEYIVCLAATHPDGTVAPLTDHMLWLGGEHVDAGHWIFVYTGPGERRATKTLTGEPAIVIHWGYRQTILSDQRIVPAMFHLGGILTARSAETLSELMKHLPLSTLPAHHVTVSEITKALLEGTEASRQPLSVKDLSPEQKFAKSALESLIKKGGSS